MADSQQIYQDSIPNTHASSLENPLPQQAFIQNDIETTEVVAPAETTTTAVDIDAEHAEPIVHTEQLNTGDLVEPHDQQSVSSEKEKEQLQPQQDNQLTNDMEGFTQNSPDRQSHTRSQMGARDKKLQNLHTHLLNSVERNRRRENVASSRSSSLGPTNGLAVANSLNASGTLQPHQQQLRNIQAITQELQKILNNSEIQQLASCLNASTPHSLTDARRGSSSGITSAHKRSGSTQSGIFQHRRSASVSGNGNNSCCYTDYLRASQSSTNYQQSTPQQVRPSSSQSSSSRSYQASPGQLRLFRYSEVQKEKQQMVKKLANKQALEATKKRKISQQSSQIVSNQIDKALNAAIHEVDFEQTHQLNFQQLGRVLYSLKVFQILAFDEHAQIVQQNSAVVKQMHTKRKFNEMTFHEELWRVCSVNDDAADVLQINVVYAVLRILFDPVKLTTTATVDLLKEYLVKYNGTKSETITGDADFHQQMIRLVEIWKELQINSFAYRQIGYLKPRMASEVCARHDEMLTFKPKLERSSEMYEMIGTAKFLQQFPLDNFNGVNNDSHHNNHDNVGGAIATADGYLQRDRGSGRSNSSSRLDGSQYRQPSNERYKILYKKQEVTESKRQLKRQERDLRELEGCTFQPDLSVNSRINEHSMLQKYNGNVNIFERLYTPESLREKHVREEIGGQLKAQSEMQSCTFQPSVNRSRVSMVNAKIDAKDLVSDFEKNVSRVKLAQQRQKEAKFKLEKHSVGEKYDENRKKKENPPTFLGRQPREQSRTITSLQVNLSKNKVVTIHLKENDHPRQFVSNFAKIHGINREMQNKLYEVVAEYLRRQL